METPTAAAARHGGQEARQEPAGHNLISFGLLVAHGRAVGQLLST